MSALFLAAYDSVQAETGIPTEQLDEQLMLVLKDTEGLNSSELARIDSAMRFFAAIPSGIVLLACAKIAQNRVCCEVFENTTQTSCERNNAK